MFAFYDHLYYLCHFYWSFYFSIECISRYYLFKIQKNVYLNLIYDKQKYSIEIYFMLGNLKHICLLYYLLSNAFCDRISVIFFSLNLQNKHLFSFILPILYYFSMCPAVFIYFHIFLNFRFCPIYFLHYTNWNAKHTFIIK